MAFEPTQRQGQHARRKIPSIDRRRSLNRLGPSIVEDADEKDAPLLPDAVQDLAYD